MADSDAVVQALNAANAALVAAQHAVAAAATLVTTGPKAQCRHCHADDLMTVPNLGGGSETLCRSCGKAQEE